MSNQNKRSGTAVFAGVLIAVWLAGMVHPFGRPRDVSSDAPLLRGAKIDPSILGVMERSCQDCHSDRTQWPWYSRIAPVSWLVEKDVRDGRKDFNMSHWEQYTAGQQEELLASISTLVRNNKMPQSKYTLLHRDAALQKADVELIYRWAHSERKRVKLQGDGNGMSAQTSTYISANK